MYSDARTRSDSLNYNTYDQRPSGHLAAPAADGTPNPNGVPVVGECCISFGSVVDEKKRGALSGALQWRPTDTLSFTLDGLYTKLDDPQVAYNQAYYPDFNYDANGDPEWSNVVVHNGLVTSFTGNTFTPELVNQTIDRKVTTSLVGLNAEWQPTSRLSFAADLYRSRANRPEGGNDAFVTAGLESTTPYNQNTINWTNSTTGRLPNISVTLPNGQDYGQALAAGQLGNDHWTAHYTGLGGNSIHDKVTGTTLDGTLKMDAGPLTQLRFGLAQTWRDKSRDDYDNDWTGGCEPVRLLHHPSRGQPDHLRLPGCECRLRPAPSRTTCRGRAAHSRRRSGTSTSRRCSTRCAASMASRTSTARPTRPCTISP